MGVRMKVIRHSATALATFSAAIAILAVSSAAAAPVLSGNYALTIRDNCQQTLGVDYVSGPLVSSIKSNKQGLTNGLLLVDFDSSTLTFTQAGFDDYGTPVLLKNSGTEKGVEGRKMQEATTSASGSYSTTDTTFTSFGLTFNAIYGQVDNAGISHYMAYQGIFKNGSAECTEQGEAIRL
jgi:hypothetical protein